MKRKLYIAVVCIVLIAAMAIPAAFAAVGDSAESAAPKTEEKINLTDAQKKELKELYEKKFEVQKQIIQKYVDFGVIPKDKADEKIERMDQMKKKLEENGYAPWHHKGKGKKGGWQRSGVQEIKQDT